ncbi:MAG TPA: AMP-binding protein, partial [Polyangiaceae bacterium]
AEIVHLAKLSEATTYVIAATHLGFDYRCLARAVQKNVAGLERILVVGDCQEFVSLANLEEEPAAEIPSEPAACDVALLLLSGGTTGTPKLIPRTHDDYLCNVRLSAEVTGLSPRTRYLVSLPIAHNFPLGCPGALGTIYAGGTVVFCNDPSPATAFRWIAAERITLTALIPPLVLLWLEAAEWMQSDFRSLQLLQVGGARLKAETAAKIRPLLGCELQQVYGMAEGLLNFTRQDDPDVTVITTQGRPMAADDEIRVVDGEGAAVPSGEVGELEVRGPYTIRGYYRAEDYNRRAFTADGYYRTGDLVRRLPSGHLIVEGRTKDVINRGGDKVPVEEVENHLLGHPAIHDVAVVGIPDESLGERSCACIIARGRAPTLPELKAYLNRVGVAAFKLPDRLLEMDRFPQTSFGKVDKQALARQACSAHARSVP